MRNYLTLGSLFVVGLLLGWPRDVAAQSIDAPMARAWPATHVWDDASEAAYSRFVATIGEAVAAHRCHTLAACLNSPAINPLHEANRPLRFRADCADVPYLLRAWFAYRNQLPFAYARAMRGTGHDDRYLREAHPDGVVAWTHFPTPRALFEQIGSDVHSGYLRTAPERDDADFYPVAVTRTSIRPGTVFYDPNGHVLVVWAVHEDGDVLFFDGHPDNTMSHPHFSARQVLGGRNQGGGFKYFRPLRVEGGVIARSPNAVVPDYADVQYDHARHIVAGRTVTFQTWVRARLATGLAVARPWTVRQFQPASGTTRLLVQRAARRIRAQLLITAQR